MNTDTVRITIGGYTVQQIIALLAKNGVNTESLTKLPQTATFNYASLTTPRKDISRLEGYLFPDTY